jgi:hypothetical protein
MMFLSKLPEKEAKSILRIRNFLMILIGVIGLLLKKWIADSVPDFVYAYMGNFTVSYAIYFLINNAVDNRFNRFNRFITALIALAIVESFEFTNGYGVMTNVYDVIDYLANALGIAFAFIVDIVSTRMILPRRLDR